MKKRIKIVLVVATIVALPLMGAQQSKNEEKSLLVDFIEYCKTCENIRQVDPNKDYTQATLHELKNAARLRGTGELCRLHRLSAASKDRRDYRQNLCR